MPGIDEAIIIAGGSLLKKDPPPQFIPPSFGGTRQPVPFEQSPRRSVLDSVNMSSLVEQAFMQDTEEQRQKKEQARLQDRFANQPLILSV